MVYGTDEPCSPPSWTKSSHSFANNNCLEVRFRKSSRSAGNGDCVEVAAHCGVVDVRDSKLGDESPVLAFPAVAWTAFVAGVRNQEF